MGLLRENANSRNKGPRTPPVGPNRNRQLIQAFRFFVASPLTKPSKMPTRPFRVGRSVTGLGLFAIRLIKKRTRIAEYKGPLLRGEDAERAEIRGNRYLFEINSRWTIDGKSRKNLARYANHSCNPNAQPVIVKRRVFISAIRNIKPGEEITYDYGNDYLRNVIGKSNCKCRRCRGRRAKKAREYRRKAGQSPRLKARKRQSRRP
jgi:hypothetical protein